MNKQVTTDDPLIIMDMRYENRREAVNYLLTRASAAGVSLNQLSKWVGVSNSHISQVRHGKHEMRELVALRIALTLPNLGFLSGDERKGLSQLLAVVTE